MDGPTPPPRQPPPRRRWITTATIEQWLSVISAVIVLDMLTGRHLQQGLARLALWAENVGRNEYDPVSARDLTALYDEARTIVKEAVADGD